MNSLEKIKVKNEHFFKNKWHMFIYLLVFALLIYLFILVGTRNYSVSIPDNERFSQEYTLVGKENVFEYINVRDVHMIASGKKGIVFMGNRSNEWANYYANILNEVALKVGVNTIYYYDFYEDREQNNATYEDTLKLLENYVVYDDLGKADFYAPSLLVVSDDEVLFFDTETSFMRGKNNPSSYWNEYTKNLKKNELETVLKEYMEG